MASPDISQTVRKGRFGKPGRLTLLQEGAPSSRNGHLPGLEAWKIGLKVVFLQAKARRCCGDLVH